MDINPLDEFKRMHKSMLYVDYKIKDLAAYLRVSRRTVERWLAGKNLPNPKHLWKIKRFLAAKK